MPTAGFRSSRCPGGASGTLVKSAHYVRVCPVCERENPPERARCACGAALGSVDFTFKPPPADAAGAPAGPPGVAVAPGAAAPRAEDRAPAAAALEDAALEDAALEDGAPEDGAPEDGAPSLPAAVAASVCPHPDCAQPNPSGRARCLYCNRPLRPSPPTTAAAAGARPLPSALRDDYRVVDAFPATGSEADLLLVEHLATGEQCVAKLYRQGLEPDLRLLALLAQAEGDYLVRLRAYGVSDGVAYEVQEYLRHGTLRQVLAAGPVPHAEVRRIVKELADALTGIHAQRILHRDLKPENVLVRSFTPLELALTDFGIASLREATQHFTGGARTAKYAAPEALTGVIDEKADWWALGMIALEAATGRHPFAGLTEPVINHHLATRPVDVRAVYDDRLRALCRGLLLRDPTRRWGGAEVARWLAGDPTLAAPDDADGHATAVRPYRIGPLACATGAELALGLARHWEAGTKDLAHGQIARWLEQELHDHNLLRSLRDIVAERGVSDDLRLLRFLLVAAPDLPPVWRGAPVRAETLLDAARRAANGDEDAERWLDSISRDGVLARFAAAGHGELGDFDRRWRDGWTHFVERWKSAQAMAEQWRRQPRVVAGAASEPVVHFDDLVFSAPEWLSLPRQASVNAALLLALFDADVGAALQREVIAGQADVAGFCPWLDALAADMAQDPVGMLVAHQLLPQARDDAATERHRQGATQAARDRIVAETRAALRSELQELLRLAPATDDLDAEAAAKLQEALGQFQETCGRALGLDFADPECAALRRGADKLAGHALAVQRSLARCEAVQGVNAIVMRPERLGLALVLVVGALALWAPWLVLVLAVAAAGTLAYRWHLARQATAAALAALRLLAMHGRMLLRDAAAP